MQELPVTRSLLQNQEEWYQKLSMLFYFSRFIWVSNRDSPCYPENQQITSLFEKWNFSKAAILIIAIFTKPAVYGEFYSNHWGYFKI